MKVKVIFLSIIILAILIPANTAGWDNGSVTTGLEFGISGINEPDEMDKIPYLRPRIGYRNSNDGLFVSGSLAVDFGFSDVYADIDKKVKPIDLYARLNLAYMLDDFPIRIFGRFDINPFKINPKIIVLSEDIDIDIDELPSPMPPSPALKFAHQSNNFIITPGIALSLYPMSVELCLPVTYYQTALKNDLMVDLEGKINWSSINYISFGLTGIVSLTGDHGQTKAIISGMYYGFNSALIELNVEVPAEVDKIGMTINPIISYTLSETNRFWVGVKFGGLGAERGMIISPAFGFTYSHDDDSL